MKCTFKEYMNDVYGQLECNATEDYKSKYIVYTHTNEEVNNNLDFFEEMYNEEISPYKVLLFFSDYKKHIK